MENIFLFRWRFKQIALLGFRRFIQSLTDDADRLADFQHPFARAAIKLAFSPTAEFFESGFAGHGFVFGIARDSSTWPQASRYL